MAADESHEFWKERLRPFIAEWSRSGLISPDFRAHIEDVIRRRVGENLPAYDDGAIDGETLGRDLAGDVGAGLEREQLARFTKILQGVATDLLSNEKPSEVTRMIWSWNPKADNKRMEEEDLFAAIEFELRKRAAFQLRKSSFGKLQHKIVPGELVSELYMKLKGYDFMRLPANRNQFYAMAEKIIENILRDMQKAASRGKRPPSRAKISLSGVGKSALGVDLDQAVEIETALSKLPTRTAKIVRLQILCGCTIEEISGIVGLSPATVKRDLAMGKQMLLQILS